MNEIYQKFVHTPKSQYFQHQYEVKDQVRNLEAINKSLDLRVKRAKLDMKRQPDGRERQSTNGATSGNAMSRRRNGADNAADETSGLDIFENGSSDHQIEVEGFGRKRAASELR